MGAGTVKSVASRTLAVVVVLGLGLGCAEPDRRVAPEDAAEDARAEHVAWDLPSEDPPLDAEPVDRGTDSLADTAPSDGGCEAAERCNDGLDNDCDGAVDEGCPCLPDQTARCYRGPAATRGVGACQDGTMTCVGSGEFGTWGPCSGDARPSAEQCDAERVDEDCDGTVNQGCECVTGAPPTTCGPRVGACRPGTQRCEDGRLGACLGATGPSPETCDGEDNDCDGEVDEDLSRPCGASVGVCRPGIERCRLGRWASCEGAVTPGAETCNGADDDCDGTVDEDLGTISCGVGVCRRTADLCVGGMTRPCVPGSPAPERCDGEDNDCDGVTDEELGTVSCGRGVCARTVTACVGGAPRECVPGAASAESCNGADDDCDGVTDEELGTVSCGVGACARTVERCVAGAAQRCAPGAPGAETCNGIDDDCDGATDEELAPLACGVGVCRRTTPACVGGLPRPCAPGAPGAETCNGADDDCDGMTDEGLGAVSCGVGACARSVPACLGGAAPPCLPGAPAAERCNGADDDCDGATDEGLGTVSCGVGACARTVAVCAGGAPQGCVPGAPGAEVCDGLDNDCDGMTDEGLGAVSCGVGACARTVAACVGGAAPRCVPGAPGAETCNGADDDCDGMTDEELGTVSCGRGVCARTVPACVGGAPRGCVPGAPGPETCNGADDDCDGATDEDGVCCTPPAAPAPSTCPTSWDRRPVLQFAPLPAGVTYEVWRVGDASPLASLTLVGQNHYRPPSALGPGGPPPGTALRLYVRACRTGAPSCCATSSTVTANLVEACAAPEAPSAANVVFSEYLINGDGGPCPGPDCEAGEAIEITNLSHCPVALAGFHFGYCNPPCDAPSYRWMDFGAEDVIPPRGVYVALRNRATSVCPFPFLGPDDPGLFGLRVSRLAMRGLSLQSGWFHNAGGGMSTLRVASGAFVDITAGTTVARIRPYRGGDPDCRSVGFDAVGACGDPVPGSSPTATLEPNQLGRLWHPCDAVRAPVPATCR